ncbi:putative ABC transporter ATP-binding protein [compost metagenome]
MILVVVVPVLFTVVAGITRKGFPMFAKVQKRLDRMNTVLQENLVGIRVVKAFVRSDYETKRFTDANDDYMAVALRANVMMATLTPVMFLLLNGTIVTVLWMGGNLFWDNALPIGDLAAFINYVTQLLSSLLMVGMMLASISRATASSERIVEVLETEPEIKSPDRVVAEHINRGQIEFDGVGFSYDGGERVLRDVSFTVQPGETLAILGATGSGKSTLVSLIPRLYEAAEGRVLIDGVDVREYQLEGLRSIIGMVLQEAILFSGTIRENISFGRPNATMEEVEAAAQAAQAHDFIMGLPQGYETVLGQRAVLIFDDSTSAVDLGTESRIQKALRERMKETTSLIIAQRISSVMEADRILVLEDGTVAASGNHRELMANSPVYRDIYRSQLGEEEIVYAGSER